VWNFLQLVTFRPANRRWLGLLGGELMPVCGDMGEGRYASAPGLWNWLAAGYCASCRAWAATLLVRTRWQAIGPYRRRNRLMTVCQRWRMLSINGAFAHYDTGSTLSGGASEKLAWRLAKPTLARVSCEELA